MFRTEEQRRAYIDQQREQMERELYPSGPRLTETAARYDTANSNFLEACLEGLRKYNTIDTDIRKRDNAKIKRFITFVNDEYRKRQGGQDLLDSNARKVRDEARFRVFLKQLEEEETAKAVYKILRDKETQKLIDEEVARQSKEKKSKDNNQAQPQHPHGGGDGAKNFFEHALFQPQNRGMAYSWFLVHQLYFTYAIFMIDLGYTRDEIAQLKSQISDSSDLALAISYREQAIERLTEVNRRLSSRSGTVDIANDIDFVVNIFVQEIKNLKPDFNLKTRFDNEVERIAKEYGVSREVVLAAANGKSGRPELDPIVSMQVSAEESNEPFPSILCNPSFIPVLRHWAAQNTTDVAIEYDLSTDTEVSSRAATINAVIEAVREDKVPLEDEYKDIVKRLNELKEHSSLNTALDHLWQMHYDFVGFHPNGEPPSAAATDGGGLPEEDQGMMVAQQAQAQAQAEAARAGARPRPGTAF